MGQRLNGKIITTKHDIIPYATVRILNSDSVYVQGVHADSLGRFSVLVQKPDYYLLNVNSLGYSSKTVAVNLRQDTILPPITLQANSVTLNERIGFCYIRIKSR